MNIYSTQHMEESLQALALIFPHIVFRRVYQNKNAIPLRMRQVKGVAWYFYSPAHVKASELQKNSWQEKGGILVNTHQTASVHRSFGCHQAMLFAECPTSLYRINAETRDTERCAVIYKPPTWREHEETINRQCPTVRDCQTAYLWWKCQHGKMVSDEELVDATKITCSPGSIRHLLYKYAGLKLVGAAVPIRLFFRPENPIDAKFYDWIAAYPAEGPNIRYIPERELLATWPRWRFLIKQLKREKVLEKKPLVYQYMFHDTQPNWDMISYQYRTRRAEFDHVQSLVDAAPLFPHAEILSAQIGSESI